MGFEQMLRKLFEEDLPASDSVPLSEACAKEAQARGDTIHELGLWGSVIFTAITASGLLAGDSGALRLANYFFWISGYALCEWARKLGKVNLSSFLLCFTSWISIALVAWNSGGYKSQSISTYILVIFASGIVGGRRLALFIGTLTLFAVATMWSLETFGIAPAHLLGRSAIGGLTQLLGIISLAILGVSTLLRQISRASEDAERERARAQIFGESFKELFMKSPAAMLLTESKTQSQNQSRPRQVISVNSAFEALLSATKEDLRSEPNWHLKLCPPAPLVEIRELLAQFGRVELYKTDIRTWNGTDKRICLVSAEPVSWEGNPALLWTFQDVTENENLQRELESANADLESRVVAKAQQLAMARNELERSERLAKLGEMVAGVAHEINTPIGNAMLSASTLSENTRRLNEMAHGASMSRSELTTLCRRLRETGELTTQNLERASDIILSFKQLSADQAGQAKREFRIREVLEAALRAVGPSLRAGEVSWSLSIDPESEPTVLEGFPGSLSQITTALASNALMHAFDGPPLSEGRQFSVKARVDATHAIISFSDNGAGVGKDVAAKIFEPFFTTKAGRGGTGLGLAVAWNLARETLAGELELTSPQPPTGCEFTLRFPLKAPARLARATRSKT